MKDAEKMMLARLKELDVSEREKAILLVWLETAGEELGEGAETKALLAQVGKIARKAFEKTALEAAEMTAKAERLRLFCASIA